MRVKQGHQDLSPEPDAVICRADPCRSLRKLLTHSGLDTELRPLVESGVTSIYDRHAYDAEKRIALDAWARTLTAIIEEQDGATVVAFARAYMDDLKQQEVTAALQRDKDLYLKTRNPRYVRHAYGLARATLARGMRIPLSAGGSSTGRAIPGWVLRHVAVSHALQQARDRYQKRGGRTSSSSSVSTIRGNINRCNRNGLFSRHRTVGLFPCRRLTAGSDAWLSDM